ncbi:Sugar transporter [Operophtera brumata]|uniref:Sugar transporter n=1 Tax=Operophtera brumata TaxID=104452 RepID=A0A0L7KVZ8_OPEBR|nr:Sugar transporter [Operophtera brumata]
MPTVMQWRGRKFAFISACLLIITGWVLAFTAGSAAAILISETFQGLGTNSLLAVSMLSLSEMVAPKYRNVSMQMFGTVQSLGMALVGIMVRYVHWKTISLIMLMPIIVALITACMWPESPSWLAHKGEFDRCEKAFIWLRGTDDVSKKELTELIRAQKENLISEKGVKKSTIKQFWTQVTRRDFYLPGLHMFLLLNMMYWSGSAVVLIYSIDMMKKATNNEDAAFLGGIAINLILFVGVATSSVLVKFFNNKTVLLSSTFAATICLFCNFLVTLLQSLEVLPKDSLLCLYFLIAFMVPNCLGLNSLVFIIAAELMPVKHRNVGGALYVIYNCTLLATSLKISPYLFLYIDLWGTFMIYAINATISGLLVWKYVPETKDKTLQEIEDYYTYGKFNVKRKYNDDPVLLG